MPPMDVELPKRAGLLVDGKKSALQWSKTDIKSSRQARLCDDKAELKQSASGTKAEKPRQLSPEVKTGNPIHASCCNDELLSTWPRPQAKTAKPSCAGLRSNNAKPGFTFSVTGSANTDPEQHMPKAGRVDPQHAMDRSGTDKLTCAKSKTNAKDPARAKERDSKDESELTTSDANGTESSQAELCSNEVKSNWATSKVDRKKSRDTRPKRLGALPKHPCVCNKAKKPKCVSPRTKIPRPKHARLRGKMEDSKDVRSKVKSGSPILVTPKRGAARPSYASIFRKTGSPACSNPGTSKGKPNRAKLCKNVAKPSLVPSMTGNTKIEPTRDMPITKSCDPNHT